ncbi:MAG: hypothetical protein A2X22_14255 [Bacteroidetes bacterium GWF2_49_14]|nr:MAG: hypothetical protein A2X22_14255 [Bacteroidetes bacterium GWF2_49_14]HBB91810.1 hypothetical protein [Bacteroidales bacterium]
MKKLNLSILLIASVAVISGFTSCKKDVPVSGVNIEQDNLLVRVGSSSKLSYSVTPIDATNKEVSFASRNINAATVGTDGTVTGVSIGETWVVVTTMEGNFKDSSKIMVDPAAGSSITLAGNITANMSLKSDVNYILDGWVYVKDGATLTIEAGTIIKGKTGSKASLIIERGGKIMAEGTAQKPIVFTSDKPAGQRSAGDWGGLILCGKAPINPTGGEAEIEGGVGSKYGGTNAADNSGVLKYVRVEFAGYAFAPDKEINGITFGGVGSGTVVDYVQVSFSNDDSYEWFGGSVNCKHLIAFSGLDDEFDTDYGFNGNIQFAVGLRDPNIADISKSNGFESDNDATGSTNNPLTNPKFANVSLFGPKPTTDATANSLYASAMHLRRRTSLEVYNSVFAGWPKGLLMADSKGAAGNIQVKGVVLAGINDNWAGNAAGEEAFFMDAARANRTFPTTAELNLTSPFTLATPNFLPKAGSPLLTGGVTVPAGLESTSYVGAFGTTDWTTGWANFTPQTSVY